MENKPKIKIKLKTVLKHTENIDHLDPKDLTIQTKKKPNFTTVKTSLKSILKDYDSNFPKINQLVIECHEIVTRTYQLIRLWILAQYHNGQPLNTINKDFILSCIRVGGLTNPQGRPPIKTDLEQQLSEFYEKEFQPCLKQPKYNLKNKSYIVPYLAIQIQTAIENNIKLHFLKRVRKVLNFLRPPNLTNDKLFKRIKNWILMNHHDSIPSEYQSWSLNFREQYLPSTYQNCYGYDVKVIPEKYLPYTIKMNDVIEQYNQNKTEQEQQRLFQPLPLRSSKIPCYITLDANCIVSLFYSSNKGRIGHHIAEHREAVWSSLFYTERKIMKHKGYHFCTVQTDGIGVSICFQKDGLTMRQKHEVFEEQFKTLETLNMCEMSAYLQRKLVGGDPGKQSSLYLMDEQKNRLRYTPRQRRAESQNLICRRIMDSEKQNYGVTEAKTILSHYNSKSIDYQSFKEYLRQVSSFNQSTQYFYQQEIWRKMKWRVWINRRRSEDQFLNRIERVYGRPEDIVICYGNWSETQQMKHLMPSQGIGLRRIVSKRFETILVDEYRTSKLCNQCHHVLDHYQKLYRVLYCSECQSNRSDSKCCFFNRDSNACMNMIYLCREWLQSRTRPLAYRRTMTLTPDTNMSVENPVSR
jgi:hypothetical protein